jgi:UDP-N-acetylglucosamine--N-acetylmuramyl-(pentapeptide) pyrophosphoryl-undecaprenol N-acetylglucosamine transferase
MFAGGGTGGHVYLAVALARELQRRQPSCDVLFVGTQRGLESRIVPREGYRVEFIASAGLKGMKMASLLRNLLLVPKSMLQSLRVVKGYRPAAVVGVGGYSSGPLVLAAWWRRCPTLIIEPNAHPGLTNRWLSRVIDRAALALPDTGGYFGSKGVVTGIPVRREFAGVPRKPRGPDFTLLVYGGSQGSHALNRIVCEALPELKELGPAFRLIHQTGEKEFEEVERAHREAGLHSDVRPFLAAIYEDFARADLILSRAGAGTMAELTVAGKAAILVPFPGAADDHQTKNARALERYGAARMIPELEWTSGRLAREVRHFMDHPEELERMEEASRKLAKPEATSKITDIILELAGATV